MKYTYIIIFLSISNLIVFSQTSLNKSNINKTDKRGLNQGFWKISMPDGMGHNSNFLEGFFYNNKKIGVWVHKNYKGMVFKEEIYFDTSLHKVQVNEFYVSGNIKSSGYLYSVHKTDTVIVPKTKSSKEKIILIDRILMKQNKWSYYFDNNLIESEGIYFEDMKDGIWRYYNTEGVLIKQELYEKGVLKK
jgi:antitoxin component YwqK of YwqJK toxin-antitoxin module